MTSSIDGSERSISTLVMLLGEPQSFGVRPMMRPAPGMRIGWGCGCNADNTSGLCLEDGWELAPCARHEDAGLVVALAAAC
jgi:hypothetical protein